MSVSTALMSYAATRLRPLIIAAKPANRVNAEPAVAGSISGAAVVAGVSEVISKYTPFDAPLTAIATKPVYV